VVDARGSIAGNTVSRGNGGPTMQAKVKGIRHASLIQVEQRARYSAGAATWRTLTPAQRTGWNDYARTTSWKNKLGASINIGGFMAFLRLFDLMHMAGQATRAEAPSKPGHAVQIVGNVKWYKPDNVVLVYEDIQGFDPDMSGDLMLLFAGEPREISKGTDPKRWKYLGVIVGSALLPPNFPKDYSDTGWPIDYQKRQYLGFVHIDPFGRISKRTTISGAWAGW